MYTLYGLWDHGSRRLLWFVRRDSGIIINKMSKIAESQDADRIAAVALPRHWTTLDAERLPSWLSRCGLIIIC